MVIFKYWNLNFLLNLHPKSTTFWLFIKRDIYNILMLCKICIFIFLSPIPPTSPLPSLLLLPRERVSGGDQVSSTKLSKGLKKYVYIHSFYFAWKIYLFIPFILPKNICIHSFYFAWKYLYSFLLFCLKIYIFIPFILLENIYIQYSFLLFCLKNINIYSFHFAYKYIYSFLLFA